MSNDKIFKNDVRILHPYEYKMLYDAVDKRDNRDKMDTMLLTGMRYNEIRWMYTHKDCFNGKTIHVPSKKVKAVLKERYVRLNNQGIRAVQNFFATKKNIPTRISWNENLKRWCKKAGLDDKGISTKTFRKTWESWLATMYTDKVSFVFLSQGHTNLTSIQYYLMCPFDEKDKQDMKYYTDGWI